MAFIGDSMIGPMEKGFKKAKIQTPPEGVYEGVDLKILPQYISYKSALIKEKISLYYILSAALTLFVLHYGFTRLEISSLHTALREKEYILAPGVMSFTKASPHMVSDSYIDEAVTDFLSTLGNFSSENIDEQYMSLKRFMSEQLKVQFDIDTSNWVDQVKTDSISQILKITQKEIISNEKGDYKVTAIGRADFYANREHLGYEDQVISMILKLVPPKSGKRWYLEITHLSWEKADTFKTKSHLSKNKDHQQKEGN